MEHRVFTVSAFKEDGTPVAVDLTHNDLSEQGRIRLIGLPDCSPLFNTDISESGFKKMLDATGGRMDVIKLRSD